MPSAVALRDDFDAPTLRRLAKQCRDPRKVRRLLGLAAIYDGASRLAAARIGGMDRQTLRDWVHRFNEAGPSGLAREFLTLRAYANQFVSDSRLAKEICHAFCGCSSR